ncbi:MAG: HAMP domain-containing sensor histidine kinase [FCB group bacterium]|jgi:signal transduction histidine kinase
METNTASDLLRQQINESFNNFVVKRLNEKSLSALIKEGLKVYFKFLELKHVYFYFLDKESFDFYFGAVLPEEAEELAKKQFSFLIEEGSIGTALTTGKMQYYNFEKDNFDEKSHLLIIPMVGIAGILGIVILSTIQDYHEFRSESTNFLLYFSYYFSSSVENLMFYDNQFKSQSLLDQLVASRTISLVESKVQLGEKIENLKSNLSMSIPHEVRTPINQILGFSDYLIKHFDASDEQSIIETKEILIDIKDSAERLRRLFENYLYYANITMLSTDVYELQALQSQVTLYSEPVIFDKVMLMASDKERKDDVQINLTDSPIAIGEQYLTKIIEEIMDNCLKYSQKGTPLIIGSEVQGEKLVLFFKDSGRGMSKEQIENIDAYMQFERNMYEQQGSGLGLTIVRKLIDLHRGEFFIESDINKYTTIILKLPIPQNINPDNY